MNITHSALNIGDYDMATEASAALRGALNKEIPGVKEEVHNEANCRISRITIFNEEGAELMHRPQGTYITIDTANLNEDTENDIFIVKSLSEQLGSILPKQKDKPFLVCGIGNPAIASDALGEKTVSRLFPTRHLFQSGDLSNSDDYSSVALFCPNVLGNTGMEAAELVSAVCNRIHPEAVIVIDALATASKDRLTSSFQLTDTGLTPGGGIHNTRPAINEATLHTPVIAIGVPTVIYPQALIAETFETLRAYFSEHEKRTSLQSLNSAKEHLFQKMENHVALGAVTPKDIDLTSDRLSVILAGAIASALHKTVSADNYEEYLMRS
ncbi:MAG: GPR endopeptidase [Firmicutes bacterium]|nr:GPR endopeptidase [Bacillota bacterium]